MADLSNSATNTSTEEDKLGVILVAAGSSSRMGFDKLMHPLAGVAVLQRALDQFQNSDLVTEVVLVCPEQRFSKLRTNNRVSHAEGGAERHFSVLNGIAKLSEEIRYIAVHDGARPLISAEQIQHVFEAACKHQAATSARRITETVKRGSSENFTTEAVSRENLWAMETPQIFHATELKNAYDFVLQKELLVTDEVSALEHIGIATKLVSNSSPNPKITYPEDIALAELLLTKTS